MDKATSGYARIAISLLMATALWGCGPGDDKGKTEKKAEPAAPPKAAPAPEPKKDAAPKPKPAPKPSAKLEAEGWTLLGKEQAGRKGESDRITVDSKDRVKELRLVVEGAPVELEAMTVTFRNDKQFKANVQHLSANSASAPIDLPGEKRRIKHVDLTYRTAAKGAGKATVMVYGR
jgi:hypothetical protein